MSYRARLYAQKLGHTFTIPNEIFSLDLCAGELAVYFYLMRCEDRRTYQCHPSYTTIGTAVGLSKRTVQKYVTSLEEKCLIYTEPTTVRREKYGRSNGSLCYTIRPIRDALAHYGAELMARNEMENERRCVQSLLSKQETPA